MITYVCIICHIEQPRAMGKPVGNGQYPSWQCTDYSACADRYLTALGAQ